MKFTQGPHNLANNQYDIILLFDKPAEIYKQDEDNFESPSPTSLQPIMQDNADDVIDLTDESETTVIQHPESVPYNNNNNELQLPTNIFVNIAPEWVEDLPQDIYGMKIYKIKFLLR